MRKKEIRVTITILNKVKIVFEWKETFYFVKQHCALYNKIEFWKFKSAPVIKHKATINDDLKMIFLENTCESLKFFAETGISHSDEVRILANFVAA